MGTDANGNPPGGDDWRSSLLRAANSLADRIASGIEERAEQVTREGGVLANAWGRLNEATSTVVPTGMRKSTSVAGERADDEWQTSSRVL